jgi:CheY-like chemotaxis protein
MGKKILLADDSLTIQKVVELTLSGTGYELTCVSNGRMALDSLKASRPDLILADVVMPEKNGYEVCEAVKGDPATARIPVILLAGTFEPFDRERADRVGNDMVITKPFDAHQLVERIDTLLGRSLSPPAAPAREEEAAPFETVSLDDTLPVSRRAAAPTEVNPFGADQDFSFSAQPAPPERPASEPPVATPGRQPQVEEISASDAEILFDVPFEPEPLFPAAAAPALPGLTEAQIEAIAARIVEKLSDRVVREIAWEVVPDLAERAVKRRIEELEREPD